MKFKNYLTSGITLIELLVGIALSGMVFLGASSLVLVLFTSNARTGQLEELAQSRNDLDIEFSNSVKWATLIDISVPNQLYLEFSGGPTAVTYVYDSSNRSLLKNAVPMLSENVAVTQFEFKNLSVAPGLMSLKIDIGLEHTRFSSVKDLVSLVVSQRKTDYTL